MASLAAAPRPERRSAPRRATNRVVPQKPKKEKTNRDPKNMNDHVRTKFPDVIAEPKMVRSFDMLWDNSETCFACCKTCWYKLFTFFCGICIAMHWGCRFVPVIFNHVWCLTPRFRLLEICFVGWLKNLAYICVRCFLSPCIESCGFFFSQVHYRTEHRIEEPSAPSKSQRKPAQQPREEKSKETNPKSVKKGVLDLDYDKELAVSSVKRQLMLT